MNLCSDGHEEVCYEGKFCPACVLLITIGDLGDEIDELKEEIEKLNEEG